MVLYYSSCGNYYREEDFVFASEETGKEGLGQIEGNE